MSINIITGLNLGENVVGLQPDSRMPHDWLRMVARVFTAYSSKTLTKSISAYIDGFHLILLSPPDVSGSATIGVTDGSAFVDDQFIGFLDTIDDTVVDAESKIEFNVNYMMTNEEYYIVLCYTWVNIMPPMKPSFDIVDSMAFDSEHQLKLGTVTWDGTNLIIVDDKRPWIEEIIGDSNSESLRQVTFQITTDGEVEFDCGFVLNDQVATSGILQVILSGADVPEDEFDIIDSTKIKLTAMKDDWVTVRSTVNS